MGATMLDTHTLVKRLTGAGVPEAQAEAHMAVFLDMSDRGFATKGDIDRLDRRMDSLATQEALSEVQRDVAVLKQDVAGLKGDGTTLKGDVADLKTGLAHLREAFESRMAAVETAIGSLAARMTTLEATMSTLEWRLMVRLGGLIVALMTAGFGVLEFTLTH